MTVTVDHYPGDDIRKGEEVLARPKNGVFLRGVVVLHWLCLDTPAIEVQHGDTTETYFTPFGDEVVRVPSPQRTR